jgi:hypothetical protein
MPNESSICDRLSKTLDILEPGLTLIEVNHKLPNNVGAKGFIDILAKDRLGNLVLIELKRSDQAARQALFEILKYMPLFRRQHGTPAHRIRCFIVSTTWRELLVPFSEFRRLCETQTEGFRIEVDEAGNVLRSEKVPDHIEARGPQPFRMHVAYLYPSADERTRALPLLRDAYANAGADGYLLLHLNYEGEDQRVIYPFGAYFVPTQVRPELLDKLTDETIAELEEAEGESSNAGSIREGAEDRFLAIVQDSIGDHFLTTNLESIIRSPESFTAMVEGGWAVRSIDRVGPFASTAVMPDAEVLALVKGVAGESTVRYARLGSPQHRLDWAEVRQGASNCLHGNLTWEAAFAWFLDHVEREFPDGVAFLQVYNPLMLPESLYRFAVDNDPEYIPQMALMVNSADGTRREGLVGTVVWDGQAVPISVDEVFAADLCDGLHEYYMHKTLGSAWELDEELMRRHGLAYDVWLLSFAPGRIDSRKRLVVTAAGVVEENADQSKPPSLANYVDSDAAEAYLRELFSEIDRAVSR